MPIYLYKCFKCNKETELRQKFDAAAPDCEKCKIIMEKQPAPSSFILKGSGFFKNDYS